LRKVIAEFGDFRSNRLQRREIGRIEEEVHMRKALAELFLLVRHHTAVSTTETSGRSRFRRMSEFSFPATLSSAA
jgi:hypothetical protein